ncbi:MAG: glucosamine-6-phosphate deaminase [Niabella sp.]
MVNSLTVRVFETRQEMGEDAAGQVAAKINTLLQQKDEVNMIFAAAPSQNEFLHALIQQSVDWSRVNAFHMDEYIDLSPDAPQGFGNFLRNSIFEKVPFKSVSYLNGNAASKEEECSRYQKLLNQYPTDIVCMGIGENGHIAFNDPPVADFKDPKTVKVVNLDEICRQQQVNDGCFAELHQVPMEALTLTIPALMSATYVFCIVPGELKADAVYNTLNQAQIHQYPSTILRSHPNAILFLDKNSQKKLSK